LVAGWWFAEPHVIGPGGSAFEVGGWSGAEGIAEAADDIGHFAKAFNVAGSKGADLGGAALVVVPELDAAAVEEGNEEAVDGGCPGEAAAGKVEFFND
jgi:hypothetical protein